MPFKLVQVTFFGSKIDLSTQNEVSGAKFNTYKLKNF